jgi:hypothetical protein
MKKKLTILSSSGFSMVEVLVGAALLGVVALGGMKIADMSQSQTKTSNQNFEINAYMKKLKQNLRTFDGCDAILGADPTTVDLSSIDFDFNKSKIIDAEVRTELPTFTAAESAGGVVSIKPITVFVAFSRDRVEDKRSISKKALAHAKFVGGVFNTCIDFEQTSIRSAYKVACETVGGSFVDVPAAVPPFSCNFTGMTGDEPLVVTSVKYVCENILGGSFNAGSCDRLETPGLVEMSNVGANKLIVNGNTRTNFDKEDCSSAPNNFVRSLNSAGEATCIDVKFCTPGYNCDGDSAPPPPPPSCTKGVDCPTCKKANEYSLVGDNSSVTGTKTCNEIDYLDEDDTCSANTKSQQAVAGVCKRIKAGSCTGGTKGIIENAFEGESCGGGKVCESGVCKSSGGGSCTPESFGTKAACLAKYDAKDCKEVTGSTDTGTWKRTRRKHHPTSVKCPSFLLGGAETRCSYERGLPNDRGPQPRVKCNSANDGLRSYCDTCGTGYYDWIEIDFICEAKTGSSSTWEGCGEPKTPPPSTCTPESFSTQATCLAKYESKDCKKVSGGSTTYKWDMISDEYHRGTPCGGATAEGSCNYSGSLPSDKSRYLEQKCNSSNLGIFADCERCHGGNDVEETNYQCIAVSSSDWEGCGTPKNSGPSTKVDCVGSFVADTQPCPQNDSECRYMHQSIQMMLNKPATFKITTNASGGGAACSNKDGDKGTKRCGLCTCFIKGTQILMGDGSYKSIELVKVGDKVVGSNNKINTVLKLKHNEHSGKKYSINGSGYFVTEGHPFMTPEGWKAFNSELAMKINPTLKIGKLKVGDVLIRENRYETINKVDYNENNERVYNFELDGTKDYYADGFLVHNK